MLILIILVLAAMLSLVLPSFREVYETMSGSLAASSYGYIRWAYAVCWIALGVMSALALALLIGTLLWKTGRRKSVEAALSNPDHREDPRVHGDVPVHRRARDLPRLGQNAG